MKGLPTREDVASQLRPRLFGVMLVIIAILLLVVAQLLILLLRPGPGLYYPWWVVALVALVLLAAYALLLPGVWKVFVGPGVGLFTGVLKGAAIAAILVGVASAGLSVAVVRGLLKNPVPVPSPDSSSSSSFGSDWD